MLTAFKCEQHKAYLIIGKGDAQISIETRSWKPSTPMNSCWIFRSHLHWWDVWTVRNHSGLCHSICTVNMGQWSIPVVHNLQCNATKKNMVHHESRLMRKGAHHAHAGWSQSDADWIHFSVHFGLSSFLHKGLLLCSRPSRIMQSVHKATGRQPCCPAIQFSDLETMVQGHC